MKKLLFILLLAVNAFAGHTGWQSPSANTGVFNWNFEDRVYNSDDSRAYITASSADKFAAITFGLSVPADSTIDSIVIRVEGYSASTIDSERVILVQLTKDGTTTGAGDIVPCGLATSEGTTSSVKEVRGSTNNLWGTTWTDDEVIASTFGVVIGKKTADTANVYIDRIQLIVYYGQVGTNILRLLSGEGNSWTAIDDAYLDAGNTTTNRGTEEYLYLSCNADSCKYQGMIKFDLSSLSGTVHWVSLHLFRKTPTADNPQIYFYRMTRDWVEDEVTWASAETGVSWTTPGGDYDDDPVIDSLTDKGSAIDGREDIYCQRASSGLLGMIQDWVDGTYPNYGLMMISEILAAADTTDLYTAETVYEIAYPPPILDIEYTPAAEGGASSARRRKIILGGQ